MGKGPYGGGSFANPQPPGTHILQAQTPTSLHQ